MTTTTNRTPTDVALSPHAWGEIWGYPEDVALELLSTMASNVVVEDEFGRWRLADGFVQRFGQAFANFDLDDVGSIDREAARPGGRSPIENHIATLPRPARFQRGR